MRSTLAGPDGVAQPGQEIEVGDDLARQLIAQGYAEMISGPAVEIAVRPAPEMAVAPRGRRKRGQ